MHFAEKLKSKKKGHSNNAIQKESLVSEISESISEISERVSEISEQFKNLYLQKFQKGSLKFQNN